MASRVGLHIGDLQLDQAIDNIAKEQKVTVEKMRAQIEKTGKTFAQYREQLRQDMTLG